MSRRFGLELFKLRILFAVIGIIFACTNTSFLIANWDILPESYESFGDSLYNIFICLVPFFTGAFALLYLIPTILSLFSRGLSMAMFDFLTSISRIFMYFPVAPLAAILVILFLYVIIVDRSLLFPQTFDIEPIFNWISVILVYVVTILMLVAYHHSHYLGRKR